MSYKALETTPPFHVTGRELAAAFVDSHREFLVAIANRVGDLKGHVAEGRITSRLITLLIGVLDSAPGGSDKEVLQTEAAQIKLAQLQNAPTERSSPHQNTRYELIHTEVTALNDILRTSAKDKPKLNELADRVESLAAKHEFGAYIRNEFPHIKALAVEARKINEDIAETLKHGGDERPQLVVERVEENLRESTSFSQTANGGAFIKVLSIRDPKWAAKLKEQAANASSIHGHAA